jgi:hypothetical protein
MSSIFRRFVCLSAACLGGVATAVVPVDVPLAHATTVIALSLPELVAMSDRVVVGTPRVRFSRWEAGRIVTYTAVDVETPIAGVAPSVQTVTVRTLGGEVDGIGQLVVGEAKLPLGDSVMLFLQTLPAVKEIAVADSMVVTALAQGAMHIDRVAGKPATIRATLSGADVIVPPTARFLPAHVAVAGHLVADVATEVRTLWLARAPK